MVVSDFFSKNVLCNYLYCIHNREKWWTMNNCPLWVLYVTLLYMSQIFIMSKAPCLIWLVLFGLNSDSVLCNYHFCIHHRAKWWTMDNCPRWVLYVTLLYMSQLYDLSNTPCLLCGCYCVINGHVNATTLLFLPME